MKKHQVLWLFLMLFASMSSNTTAANNTLVKETCFSIARNWVIQTEGEINIDNVGYVLELTEYLNTTGTC